MTVLLHPGLEINNIFKTRVIFRIILSTPGGIVPIYVTANHIVRYKSRGMLYAITGLDHMLFRYTLETKHELSVLKIDKNNYYRHLIKCSAEPQIFKVRLKTLFALLTTKLVSFRLSKKKCPEVH